MSLLPAVENRFGSFDDWPSSILRYLFIDAPTPSRLKKMVAFFYDNGFRVQWLVNYFTRAMTAQVHLLRKLSMNIMTYGRGHGTGCISPNTKIFTS
jgi:hypothetical protein